MINLLVGLALGIPAAIIMIIILIFLGAEGEPETWLPVQSWIRYLLVIPCGYLYEAIAQSYGGADIGKIICGLRVIDEKEEKANILQGIYGVLQFLLMVYFSD